MKAIILAAGEGKRMLPLTETVPKPMIRVHEKPLLSYIFDSIPEEITEFIVVVGYKNEVIQEFYKDHYRGRSITYVIQPKKTGTAPALLLCQPFLNAGERFLLTYADDVYDKESITRCLRHEHAFLVAKTNEPKRYGVVELSGDGTICSIEEKPEHPKSDLVAPGVYVINTDIFKFNPTEINGELYLTTMFSDYLREHEVFPETASFWVTIGYPRDLARAESLLASVSFNDLE